MKKAITLFLILTMLVGGGSIFTALASDNNDTSMPQANVVYLPIGSSFAAASQNTGLTDTGADCGLRGYTAVDLGTNGSSAINWALGATAAMRSTYNYKVASGNLILRLQGSPTASIVLYLYDSTDSCVAQKTVQVSTSNIVQITFNNLFANREYYVKIENVCQFNTTVTGSIAAS